MTDEQRDIERALFGSPLGAFQALWGLFLILLTPVLLIIQLVQRHNRHRRTRRAEPRA